MALQEGCRRLRTASKALLFGGLMGVGGTLLLASRLRASGVGRQIPLLVAGFFFCELAGGGLQFLAWILEGFALPSSTGSERVR
jgi:hypothetical protein